MILFQNEFYELSRSPTGVFRLVRLPKPFGSIEELPVAHHGLLDVLAAHPARFLLIDLRAAPSRNDPEFERAFAPFRTRLSAGAQRVALLVRSKAGALQIARLAKSDRTAPQVFEDEAAAIAWLSKA